MPRSSLILLVVPNVVSDPNFVSFLPLPKSSLTALFVAALVLALAACTVGPDYVRPDVKVPDAWKEAPYKTAEPADTLPRGD